MKHDRALRMGLVCIVAWWIVSLEAARSQTLPSVPASHPSVVLAPEIRKSVDLAIKYFISKQNKDGWICDITTEQTAITALAILAMESSGVKTSQQTQAGAVMRKALAWELADARLRDDGYFGRDGSTMYTHGITTWMLAKMSGQGANDEQNALIKSRLQKGVDLILEAQKNSQAGGWRYEPASTDADVSVTQWEVRALTSARDAGIEVPKDALDKAAEFVKNCAAPEGGFGYLSGTPSRWTDTAGGVVVLQLCGEGKCAEAKSAIEYLPARPVPADRNRYLYACPAYVRAMGGVSNEELETARGNVADTVLKWQQADGSWLGWPTDNDNGEVYSTSLAVIALTTKAVGK